MQKTKVLGHCLCREIEYSLTSEPIWCGHCHCGDCRRNTGSSVATIIVFDKDAFTLTKGTLKEYASSAGVTRSFCDNCGTPVAYESEFRANEIHLNIGTLKQPEKYPAKFHVFCKEQLPWLTISDDAKRYQTLPGKR